jgi:hypothetical protein
MKKWLFLLILILPQLLKAGTTVIHVETEGWGTIQHADADTAANTKGAMFWNGTKWVTNETAAHMFFTDIRTGKRLKEYNIINVSDRTSYSPVFDSLSYHITRQNYQYSYPAKQGGAYQYEAVEYLIGDTTAKKVVIRSRGTGNGIENSYFDIFVEVVPNQITAIRNDPQWFTYPAGMSMEEALEQISPTQYLTGTLPTTDGYYFMDQNGGSDMGGLSYNFHTGPLTGNPNTDDLSPSYPTDFMLKFMDSIHQLEEFKFLPELIRETYIPEGPTTIVLSNERGLIDELQHAGYGDSCLYNVLMAIKSCSNGLINDTFMGKFAVCSPESDLFTATLNNFTNKANNPVCINTDGTLHVAPLSGRDYYRQNGYQFFSFTKNGIGRVFIISTSKPENHIDCGNSYQGQASYKANIIVW